MPFQTTFFVSICFLRPLQNSLKSYKFSLRYLWDFREFCLRF
ncbi:hypothetical protein NEIMUCOT_05115 [Neisseria mucosa ATCC 25996]|uniref:Uncharacterized protein n=1 Tax=Neisseria mucosa (strain ATCC 25996 / DSM 4631 / NCTC 10774 / M26) TaxID=546266 RepID=D2ZWW7_NEIM2|nr:hypothetical protein NEIMUCOT_05115 [Neisseria mucosa ATCC 25996]